MHISQHICICNNIYIIRHRNNQTYITQSSCLRVQEDELDRTLSFRLLSRVNRLYVRYGGVMAGRCRFVSIRAFADSYELGQ